MDGQTNKETDTGDYTTSLVDVVQVAQLQQRDRASHARRF